MIGRHEEPKSMLRMPCIRPEWENVSSHWHNIGKATLYKEHVGSERVKVRVEVQVFTESVDGLDIARTALGQYGRASHLRKI